MLLIFRFVYRQLSPFEKIARLTTATRAIMDNQLTRKASLFRLGYPITKIPIISMRFSAKDRFQELKELIRREKVKEYQAGENGEDIFSAMPITAITSNDTGKKRPGYETSMSRPRHFSRMNVKPTSENIDNNMATTVSQQVIIIISVLLIYTYYIFTDKGLEYFDFSFDFSTLKKCHRFRYGTRNIVKYTVA